MEVKSAANLCLDEKEAIVIMYFMIADADFNISLEEASLIDKKINLLFSSELIPEYQKFEIIEKIKNYAVGLSDSTKKETVKYLSERVLLSYEQYIDLINDLEDIAKCDNYVSVEEHSLMYYIRLKFRKNYARSEQYDVLNKTAKVLNINDKSNFEGIAA